MSVILGIEKWKGFYPVHKKKPLRQLVNLDIYRATINVRLWRVN